MKRFVGSTTSHRQYHVCLPQQRILHITIRLRVNLRLNLNGMDTGLSKHMAIFVHIMVHGFDSALDCPFTGYVALSILDQANSLPDRDHILEMLIAKHGLLAFQRPTKKGNYKGYGHVEFTPIEDVFAVTKTYVKKDFLIVRIKARPMRKFLMGMVEAQNANGQHQKGKKK